MNKKIFKSLFMGALLVGSVGTLTSCSKDYDNDINSLKDQIAKMATTEALNAKVTELQTSITAANSTANTAKTTAETALKNAATNAADLATLKTSVNDLSTLVKSKADQTALDAAVANLNTLIAGKVDKSVYDAGVKALQDLVDANAANITKNTSTIEANKKAVDDKIAEIVAAIAKCAPKDSLDAAVKKLEGQIGQRPTQEEVTKQITDAITAIKATLEEQFNNNLQDAKDNLITLIDKKASTDALEAAKKVLQDEIDGAVARIGDLETAVGDLKGRVGTLEENLKNKVEIADFNTAISKLTESYNGLQKQIDALMNSIDTMVTSVELWTGAEDYNNLELDLNAYVEQETTFGPNGEVIFKKGTRRTTSDDFIVRVSPTTASLSKDSISLMNSQNQDLKEYLDITCEPYTELLTSRATATTSKNGLWKLTFKLKENLTDQQYKDFVNTVHQVNGNNTYDVNFCVAVKSGIVGSNRAVVSSYNVVVNPGELTPKARINFLANNKEVAALHNRYYLTEDGGKSTKNIKELEWKRVQIGGKNVQIPYTKENITADNTFGKNTNAYLDNRQNKDLLDVDINTPIKISFPLGVRAFYVTLDKDNAIESDPSEIVAWEKYAIDGLNTVYQDINGVSEGIITIKDDAAKGDKIGFRVYAVNFDGTLQDPDGRAFYVNVLNREIVSNNTATVDSLGLSDGPNRTVTAAWSERFNAISGNSAMKNFSALVYANVIESTNRNNPELLIHFYNYKGEEIPMLFGSSSYNTRFNELTADEANSIDYIRYEMVSPKDWLDGETYNYSYTVKDLNGKILHIFNVKFTKSDLTADTKSIVKTQFQAKDKQVVENVFKAYMTPNVLDGATTGSILLKDAFDGLWSSKTNSLMDANYKFTFTKADGTTLTSESPYKFSINKDLIDNKTSYRTTVDYLYKNYSYTMDDNGVAEYNDVPVTYSDFNTIFCCIFDSSVMTWKWADTSNTIKYATASKSFATSLISGTNTYNATLYSTTLNNLLDLANLDTKYLGGLKIVANSAHLITNLGNVVDQYFTVDATNSSLTFTPNPSATVNPTGTVESTLVLECVDSFGHTIKVSVPFSVTKQ